MAPPRDKQWENVFPRGPTLRALCCGINQYAHLDPLSNSEQDADEIAKRVRKLSDGRNGKCVAKLRQGSQLKDKEAMKSAVIDFLNEIDKDAPPRYMYCSWKVGNSIIFHVVIFTQTHRHGHTHRHIQLHRHAQKQMQPQIQAQLQTQKQKCR